MVLPSIETVFISIAVVSIIVSIIYYRAAYYIFFAPRNSKEKGYRIYPKRKIIAMIITAVLCFCVLFTLYFLMFYRFYIK